MELRGHSQWHYIKTAKDGKVVKLPTVCRGRPVPRFKSLSDIYESEALRNCDGEFETRGDGPCFPFAERTLAIDAELDCHDSDAKGDEMDDCSFGKMTLKEIMKRCKAKKRSSKSVDMDGETVTISASESDHSNFPPTENFFEHEEPLINWQAKLKTNKKIRKKCKNRCAHNSSTAPVIKSEPCVDDLENQNLQLSVVFDDMPAPVFIKPEPVDIDYSDSQSMICISENSSLASMEDAGDGFDVDSELAMPCDEESHVYALTLIPHEIDNAGANTVTHVDFYEDALDADISEATDQKDLDFAVSEIESEEYQNSSPPRGGCTETLPTEFHTMSGQNDLQSCSPIDEMPREDNGEVHLEVTNISILNDAGNVDCNDNESCLATRTDGADIRQSVKYFDLASDSKLCNMSSPVKDCSLSPNGNSSVSLESLEISKCTESTNGVSPSKFGNNNKEDVPLYPETSGLRSPVKLCSSFSKSAVNGKGPTVQDCRSPWSLGLPVSHESCVISEVDNSPKNKDPIISDHAINFCSAIDELPTTSNGRCDQLRPRRPKKLLSCRKLISPSSQRRLRQILEFMDLEDEEDHKSREKVSVGKHAPHKIGRSERAYQNGGSEVTANPKLSILKKPRLILKKPKDDNNDILPKDNIEVHPHSRRMPNVTTGCNSIESWSPGVVEFSKRQMYDTKCRTLELLNELNSMKNIIEERLQSELQPAVSMPSNADKLQLAIKNATRVEESTRRWLSMMSRDCKRFCRLMALTENGSAATLKEVKRERKITFADEVGKELRQVKMFEVDVASV